MGRQLWSTEQRVGTEEVHVAKTREVASFNRRVLRWLEKLVLPAEKWTHKSLYMKAGFRSCSVFFLVGSSPLPTKEINELGFHIWPICGSQHPKQGYNEVVRRGWKETLHDLSTVRGPAAAGQGAAPWDRKQQGCESCTAQPLREKV